MVAGWHIHLSLEFIKAFPTIAKSNVRITDQRQLWISNLLPFQLEQTNRKATRTRRLFMFKALTIEIIPIWLNSVVSNLLSAV